MGSGGFRRVVARVALSGSVHDRSLGCRPGHSLLGCLPTHASVALHRRRAYRILPSGLAGTHPSQAASGRWCVDGCGCALGGRGLRGRVSIRWARWTCGPDCLLAGCLSGLYADLCVGRPATEDGILRIYHASWWDECAPGIYTLTAPAARMADCCRFSLCAGYG